MKVGSKGGEKISRDDERMVTVCAACFTASCWHGEFMCDDSKYAGTVDITVKKLRQLDLEHPSNYSINKIEEIYGSRHEQR